MIATAVQRRHAVHRGPRRTISHASASGAHGTGAGSTPADRGDLRWRQCARGSARRSVASGVAARRARRLCAGAEHVAEEAANRQHGLHAFLSTSLEQVENSTRGVSTKATIFEPRRRRPSATATGGRESDAPADERGAAARAGSAFRGGREGDSARRVPRQYLGRRRDALLRPVNGGAKPDVGHA